MKRVFLMAAIAPAMVVGSAAGAGELPTFEMMGFPITPHQVAVVGSANVEEQSPTAMLMLGGMPASPHQVAVLTPRPMIIEAIDTKLTTIGLSPQ